MKDSTTFVNTERRKFFDLVGKAGVAAGILRASPLVAGIFANRYAQAAGTMSKRVIFVYTPMAPLAAYGCPVGPVQA